MRPKRIMIPPPLKRRGGRVRRARPFPPPFYCTAKSLQFGKALLRGTAAIADRCHRSPGGGNFGRERFTLSGGGRFSRPPSSRWLVAGGDVLRRGRRSTAGSV